MKKQLVFLDDYIKSEPYTTSNIIAEFSGNSHHAIQQMITKYENDLAEFGSVAFEMRARQRKTGAAVEKIYHLNEQQATLLITYLKNTEPVREFKKALVHSFYMMKEELIKRQINRHDIKPIHMDLAEAVKQIPPHKSSKHDYSKYNSLAYIIVFGCSAGKLKKLRNGKPNTDAADYLTSEESKQIAEVKKKIAFCLNKLKMTYPEIKQRLLEASKAS